ncbi:MAG TPA: site-2 protease family protein, partial [Gemmataceae bacterium]|nr:site-2 protease family protein [Gemmataceae bacterium]
MDKFQAPGDPNPVTPPPPGANAPGSPATSGSPTDAAPDESQLPAGVWLVRNGLWIVAGALALVFLYRNFGPEGMWNIAKAALGLSFVIFIHELGHFAVAKWCDVHVETFSIGFGPALPGCRFTCGETTYKLALLPLGGYVKMKGEGTDDEEDDDPRSFKNKTVGQRMAIISAGVIMNLILGFACFVAAYYSGVQQTAGVVGAVEPGSPAWTKNLHSGLVIDRIGDARDPSFEDLKYVVMLSRSGQELDMAVHSPYGNGTEREFTILPRRTKDDPAPVIGIQPPMELKLLPERYSKRLNGSFLTGPAAAARALDLRPGDVVTATTDPKDPSRMKDLAPAGGATDHDELARRVMALSGKPMTLKVRRAGSDKVEDVDAPAVGFRSDDAIVSVTDPAANGPAYDPFRLKELAEDPRDPGSGRRDYFEFTRRMRDLAGRPVVVQVERKDGERASLFVPPAFYHTAGMRMGMGKISGVRDGSPAAAAGVRAGDVLRQLVLLNHKARQAARFTNHRGADALPGPALDGWAVDEQPLDPLRLPHDAASWVRRHGGGADVKAVLTVTRVGDDEGDPHNAQPRPKKLDEVGWDDARRYDLTGVFTLQSPMALNELGLAYRVETTVEEVARDSPAARAGLRKGDVILAVGSRKEKKELSWFDRLLGRTAEDVKWVELYTEEKTDGQGAAKKAEPMWARVFFVGFQAPDAREVKLKVSRGGEELPEVFTVRPEPDPTWPADERGLAMALTIDWRVRQASNPLEAIQMGVARTHQMVMQIYASLARIVTGRVSATKNLHGPIAIA